jgi:SAM-dependent methyltransferase
MYPVFMWWLILFLLFLTSFAYAGLKGAPWVPSRRDDTQRFLVFADIKKGDIVYDLGSGDGRIIIAAARAGADAHGYELSLLPYLISQIRRFFSNDRARIHFHFKNFWRIDLRRADLVYLFLTPPAYAKLKIKFEKELKPGARVVSYVWPIEGWNPERVSTKEGRPKMYLYKR